MNRSDRLLLTAVGVAAAAGVAISAYLTVVHFQGAPLVCSASGLVNCERVVTSAYGSVLGSPVPTSAAGLAWFAVGTALAVLQVRMPRSNGLAYATLGWATVGLLTAIYLVFVEIVKLGAVCAWCTAAHLLVLVIFLIALTRVEQLSARAQGPEAAT